MLWVLLLVGNGSHLSLQLVQSSKVGSLVTGKPWLTHGNPCLFNSYGIVFGWKLWPASDPSWATVPRFTCLVFAKLLLLAGFSSLCHDLKILFYLFLCIVM